MYSYTNIRILNYNITIIIFYIILSYYNHDYNYNLFNEIAQMRPQPHATTWILDCSQRHLPSRRACAPNYLALQVHAS